MNLLKRGNWWCWLLLMLASFGTAYFVLGALLNVYKKEAWYSQTKSWLLGIGGAAFLGVILSFSGISFVDGLSTETMVLILAIMFALIPAFLMAVVFSVQITATIAATLDAPGRELYLSPYTWMLLVIVPIIGWILLIVMLIYIYVWNLVMLARGMGERYITQ